MDKHTIVSKVDSKLDQIIAEMERPRWTILEGVLKFVHSPPHMSEIESMRTDILGMVTSLEYEVTEAYKLLEKHGEI